MDKVIREKLINEIVEKDKMIDDCIDDSLKLYKLIDNIMDRLQEINDLFEDDYYVVDETDIKALMCYIVEEIIPIEESMFGKDDNVLEIEDGEKYERRK